MPRAAWRSLDLAPSAPENTKGLSRLQLPTSQVRPKDVKNRSVCATQGGEGKTLSAVSDPPSRNDCKERPHTATSTRTGARTAGVNYTVCVPERSYRVHPSRSPVCPTWGCPGCYDVAPVRLQGCQPQIKTPPANLSANTPPLSARALSSTRPGTDEVPCLSNPSTPPAIHSRTSPREPSPDSNLSPLRPWGRPPLN